MQETPKCELYLDHTPLWGGDGYFCSKCMLRFDIAPAPTPQVEGWELSFDNWKVDDIKNARQEIKNFFRPIIASREQQAYERGYENGRLAEIEAGAGGEIEIAKEKVNQIRQAERERIAEGATKIEAELCAYCQNSCYSRCKCVCHEQYYGFNKAKEKLITFIKNLA